jgi:heat shock protein HslJ
LVFLDREVADPDRPLTGRLWTVDTFIQGGAAGNFPLQSAPTLAFDEDGSLQVDSGCNTGSGKYTRSGDQLTLADLAYTEIACSGATAAAETMVQAVLRDGTLQLEIDRNRLTLQRGDVGLSATTP